MVVPVVGGDALGGDEEGLAGDAGGGGAEGFKRLEMVGEFGRDDLPVCFREFVHLHAGEEFHGETHGGVVLEAGCHGGQGDGGVLAEVGLHGDVGAVALGHGRGGLHEEGVAEVGPFVPAEGALEEELGEVVDFAAGEDAPDAGFLVAVEEGGGGRALW